MTAKNGGVAGRVLFAVFFFFLRQGLGVCCQLSTRYRIYIYIYVNLQYRPLTVPLVLLYTFQNRVCGCVGLELGI